MAPKNFFNWLSMKAANGIVTGLFLSLTVLGVAYAAIAWPGTVPNGETAGGKFASVLNAVLASGNYATDTTGKVKLAAATDQIGTMSDGKWCKVSGGKIVCSENAPTGSGSSIRLLGAPDWAPEYIKCNITGGGNAGDVAVLRPYETNPTLGYCWQGGPWDICFKDKTSAPTWDRTYSDCAGKTITSLCAAGRCAW